MGEFEIYHDKAYWQEVAIRRKKYETKLLAKGIVPNSSKWYKLIYRHHHNKY